MDCVSNDDLTTPGTVDIVLSNHDTLSLLADWVSVSLQITLIATLIAVSRSAIIRDQKNIDRQQAHRQINYPRSTTELEESLNAATRMNNYDPRRHDAPGACLANAIRITPTDFATASNEITRVLHAKMAASIDLSEMSEPESARLVDFCNGSTTILQG